MSNQSPLRNELNEIVTRIIQLPRGKTVAPQDYTNAILDVLIRTLPEAFPSGIPNNTHNRDIYFKALTEAKQLLLEAKGDK